MDKALDAGDETRTEQAIAAFCAAVDAMTTAHDVLYLCDGTTMPGEESRAAAEEWNALFGFSR